MSAWSRCLQVLVCPPPRQHRGLMENVEERYGFGVTTITSQVPIKAWHDVSGEPTFADAVPDRIVHNAYRLELEGQTA